MTRIKYSSELIKYISLFEALTRTKLKDCLVDIHNQLIFLVNPHQAGRAIGRGGSNIDLLKKKLNRKIKIVEFAPGSIEFIKNMIFPLKVKEISQENKTISISCFDTKTKGLLIGRNAQNLRNLENIVKRYFDIDEIKII